MNETFFTNPYQEPVHENKTRQLIFSLSKSGRPINRFIFNTVCLPTLY